MSDGLFFDGFDGYNSSSDLTTWGYYPVSGLGSLNISSGNGRFGTKCLVQNIVPAYYNSTKNITPSAYITGGFAFYRSSDNIEFFSLGSNFMLKSVGGKFQVTRSSTVLGTSTLSIPYNVWVYVEFSVYIHDTLGSFEIKMDTETVLSASGVDTREGGTGLANYFTLGTTNSSFVSGFNYFDDFYIRTSNTAAPAFLGDCRVELKSFASDATPNEWIGSDGNQVDNYILLNDANSNTYIASANANAVSLFNMTDLVSGAPNVYGVSIKTKAKKNDAGTISFAPVYQVDTGDITQAGNTNFLSVTEQPYQTILPIRMDTSQNWTSEDINSAKFGVKVII